MTAEVCPDCRRKKTDCEHCVGGSELRHDAWRLSRCQAVTIVRLRSELEANKPRFAFFHKALGLAAEVATELRAELDSARSELEAANKRIADLDERLSIADNELEQYR